MINLNQMAQAMSTFYPSKKTNHLAIAKKYLKECQSALSRGILLANEQQITDELIPVSWEHLRKACGTYGPKKQQAKWFDWLHEHYPLLIKVKSGYNFGKKGTLTMVTTTHNIELILAARDPAETFKAFYSDETDSAIDWVNIDLRSLGEYIQHNQDTIPNNDTHKAKLAHNLKDARIIFDIASYTGGQLPQVINESEFGRKYYRGPNLQSVAKIVRQAALGHCHSYDLEASVFTWKLDMSKDIMPEIKLPETLDYLDHKDYHRKRLAELVFMNKTDQTIATIKQAITAIGFGARATNAVWMFDGKWKTTALREIIRSQEYLDRFLNDQFIKGFIQEQDTMNLLIFNQVKDLEEIKELSILKSPTGRLSRNKTLSYLYQQAERTIINDLLKIAEPAGILLLCHDGFYTKNRANLMELRSVLKQHLANGKIDHEEHHEFRYNADYDLEVSEHKNLIRQQESALRQQYGSLTKDHYDSSPRQIEDTYYEDFDNGYCDESISQENYDPSEDPWLDDLTASDRAAYLNQRSKAFAKLEFDKVFNKL